MVDLYLISSTPTNSYGYYISSHNSRLRDVVSCLTGTLVSSPNKTNRYYFTKIF